MGFICPILCRLCCWQAEDRSVANWGSPGPNRPRARKHKANTTDNAFFAAADDCGLRLFQKERSGWGCRGHRCIEYAAMSRTAALTTFSRSHACPDGALLRIHVTRRRNSECSRRAKQAQKNQWHSLGARAAGTRPARHTPQACRTHTCAHMRHSGASLVGLDCAKALFSGSQSLACARGIGLRVQPQAV